MINKEKLIEWCWDNLQFSNCSDNWEETEIVDILNGYNGDVLMKNGSHIKYYQIRDMFREDD